MRHEIIPSVEQLTDTEGTNLMDNVRPHEVFTVIHRDGSVF